jgi:hypothetical protein
VPLPEQVLIEGHDDRTMPYGQGYELRLFFTECSCETRLGFAGAAPSLQVLIDAAYRHQCSPETLDE